MRNLIASLAAPPRGWAFAIGLTLSLALGNFANAEPLAKRKVIIDQDAYGPGGSNMASMLLLIEAPDVDVVGITIESGDGWNRENVAHTLRLLELVGRPDIPVYAGVTRPLINSERATEVWESRYGKLVYKGAWQGSDTGKYHPPEVVPPLVEGETALKPAEESAVEFMVRALREHPGEITIVALGPLTNLAAAAQVDEHFTQNAASLVVMGGSLNPSSVLKDMFDREYKHHPRLEFNFRWDPEATRIVLRSTWKKLIVLPVDATTQNRATPELMAKLKETNSPAALYLTQYYKIAMPMWDEIAAAIWLRPSLIDQSETLALDVETDSGSAYGYLLSWEVGRAPGMGEREATVVRSIHIPEFEAFYLETLGHKTPPRTTTLPNP